MLLLVIWVKNFTAFGSGDRVEIELLGLIIRSGLIRCFVEGESGLFNEKMAVIAFGWR